MLPCFEQAESAYTIEDAIYWHGEVITELAFEIRAVAANTWLNAGKTQSLAKLEECLAHHQEALNRLVGVAQRDEQFVWRP
jgi:hypothetical protein